MTKCNYTLGNFFLILFKRSDYGIGRIFLSCPTIGQLDSLIWSATEEYTGGLWGTWKDVNGLDTKYFSNII